MQITSPCGIRPVLADRTSVRPVHLRYYKVWFKKSHQVFGAITGEILFMNFLRFRSFGLVIIQSTKKFSKKKSKYIYIYISKQKKNIKKT